MAFVSGVTVTGSSVRGASVSNSVRRPASCRRETRVNMAMEAPVMDVMIRSSEVLNTAILIASKETVSLLYLSFTSFISCVSLA